MLFNVHPDSTVPIYEQIVGQVIFGIASGDLAAESLIPSVRELAQVLLVHPNTVARAYQELERHGVVASRRGRGMEVTAEAPDLCKELRRDIVQKRIREALREAVCSALSEEEIRKLLEQEVSRLNGKRRG